MRLPADNNIRQIEKEIRKAIKAGDSSKKQVTAGYLIIMFTEIEVNIFRRLPLTQHLCGTS